MKVCIRCKIEKDITEFYSEKRSKDGLRCYCKKCCYETTRKSYKEWCEKNADKIREYQRKQRIKKRIEKGYAPRKKRAKREYIGFSNIAISRYGYDNLKKLNETRTRKCELCGSEKDLTIHHLDNNGVNLWKKKRYSEMNNSPDNLQILCRSCHGTIHTHQKKHIPKKLWWLKHSKGKKGKQGRKKGHKVSEDTRKKMSIKKKLYWKNKNKH